MVASRGVRARSLVIPSVGLAAGLLSGLFGVGGGIVMVPLLVLVAGLSQHRSHATSLGAILPIAAVGAVTFALDGKIDPYVAGALAAGSLFGAPLGARLMMRISEGWLKVVFGCLMMATGTLLLWP